LIIIFACCSDTDRSRIGISGERVVGGGLVWSTILKNSRESNKAAQKNDELHLASLYRHMRHIDILRQRLQSSLIYFFAALILVAPQLSQSETEGKIFSFHLAAEPSGLDPSTLGSGDGGYLFVNVLRGLYYYRDKEGLQPEGAKECHFVSKLKLVCRLNEKVKWSDGKTVLAEDYVRSLRHLANGKTKSGVVARLIANLKNSMQVNSGEKMPEELGVHDVAGKLVFDFEREDPEFFFKLSGSVIVPMRTDNFPDRSMIQNASVNGPYKIANWKSGRKIELVPNPFYPFGEKNRPPVTVLILDEDQTAMNLYESGKLSFLRRLPTSYIPKYKSHPDFKQLPVARFDYIGFGPELIDQPDFRAALSLSADYAGLAKILDALGRPGCPSLPDSYMDRPYCLNFDLEKARAHWAKVKAEIKAKRWPLYFSNLGGDDIKKQMEWFQAQWKKNLGLEVELRGTEQGVYLQLLAKSPPAIFRKGVNLDRPTCLAAVETFAKDGSENFIHLSDPEYEASLKKLRSLAIAHAPQGQQRVSCRESVTRLLDRNLIIPLGQIHFTVLASPEFTGWSLNSMNQLDLSRLKLVDQPAKGTAK
jgi:oligopeptide transport system substrate-binding protein